MDGFLQDFRWKKLPSHFLSSSGNKLEYHMALEMFPVWPFCADEARALPDLIHLTEKVETAL